MPSSLVEKSLIVPKVKCIPPSSYLGDHQLGNRVGFINGEHRLRCDFFQGGHHVDAGVVDQAVQTFVSHNFLHFLDHFLDAVFTDHICTEEPRTATVNGVVQMPSVPTQHVLNQSEGDCLSGDTEAAHRDDNAQKSLHRLYSPSVIKMRVIIFLPWSNITSV